MGQAETGLVGDRSVRDRSVMDGLVGDGSVRNGSVAKKVAADPPFNWYKATFGLEKFWV
jgi:hypothetical protein